MSREDGAVLSIYGAKVNADGRPRVPYLSSFVKQTTCLRCLRQFLSSYGIAKVFEPPLSYNDVKYLKRKEIRKLVKETVKGKKYVFWKLARQKTLSQICY